MTVIMRPYSAERPAHLGEIKERFAGLRASTRTTSSVVVAGRIVARRLHGGVAFFDLADFSGEIQLWANRSETADFDSFGALSLGDWIHLRGEVCTTARAELSVLVCSWQVLAPCRRGWTDKRAGLVDPEVRRHNRELDLWVTSGARNRLLARSAMISAIRGALASAHFVEVETPILQPVYGGAAARPFTTYHHALGETRYLRIAPELYLKRLVVAGFERVFEIGKDFRNEGADATHAPEFTMLEAYQAYGDLSDMMILTERLVTVAAEAASGHTTVTVSGAEVDLGSWRRATMAELVSEALGEEVSVASDPDRFARLAKGAGVPVRPRDSAGRILASCYDELVEGRLVEPTFVSDWPAEVSPLARPHRDNPDLAERFEAVVGGHELANAFSELTDPDIQRANFEKQARAHALGDDEAMVSDEEFLDALELGLPPTGGLGIGIDRLAMLLTGSAHIRDVLTFPPHRRARPPRPELADNDAKAAEESKDVDESTVFGKPLAEVLNDDVRPLARFCTPSICPQREVQDIYSSDVSVSASRFGSLSSHKGSVARAETALARAQGAEGALVSVSGGTGANQVVLRYLARKDPDGLVLVHRGAHHSVLGGLAAFGLLWKFLSGPRYDAEFESLLPPSPYEVEASLKAAPSARAVLVTSPTYEGRLGDLAAIAEVTHAHGALLVVDEAWGAHLVFSPLGVRGALASGADLVVQSTHKLAGSLQQTGCVLWQGPRVDPDLLERAWRELTTTSPSYHLLASLEEATRAMEDHGATWLSAQAERAARLRDLVTTALPAVATLGGGQEDVDPIRLTLGLGRYSQSGFALARTLASNGIVAEKAGLVALTFIVTPVASRAL